MQPPKLPDYAALFLDFDGVLVEIASRPDAVHVPAGLPAQLQRLYDHLGGAVALISGRHVADLRSYLPDFPGIIAGSHGAEIALGEGTLTAFPIDLDVAAIHLAARDFAEDFPAILVEEKPHGVVMHYRADPSLEPQVRVSMEELAGRFPGTKLQPAKMAMELQPDGAGKDGALKRIMSDQPFAGREPVYVGDDLTDEPAMAAAQAHGGFAVKIGEGETVARYRLACPRELAHWLDSLTTE